MGSGCCKTKDHPPVPVTITTSQVPVPETKPLEKPYGYIRLHAGVGTSGDSYTCPTILLHTYTKAQNSSAQSRSIFNTSVTRNNGTTTGTNPPNQSTSVNTVKKNFTEKVQSIPVENIISAEYSTDVKEETQTHKTVKERLRPSKPKLGCCGRMKKSLKETFCCCPICPCVVCQPEPVEKPKYDTNEEETKTSERMILIKMKYIRYTNIHIPTHVQVLSNDEKAKFYNDNFKVDTIEFYLVNNIETDGNRFDVKRNEAEKFIRIITQLRNMANHYPSEIELDKILQQEQAAVFGNELLFDKQT